MTELLDHDNHEMRKKFREFMSDPVFVPKYNVSLEEEREIALARLQAICDVSILMLNFLRTPWTKFACMD